MRLSSVMLAAAGLLVPVYSRAIISIGRRAGGLNVNLSSTGNTKVLISVTNTGSSDISVLKTNTFFDRSPTKKVNVYREDPNVAGSEKEVPFNGIHLRYTTSNLTKDDFQFIAPGQTIDTEFDLAETLDLSESGNYVASSQGVFPFSNAQYNGISGVIPFKSNEIKIKVDGKQAAKVLSVRTNYDHLARRADINDGGCDDQQKPVISSALKRASGIAASASNAALNGDVRVFEQFFRTTDTTARQQVSDRFRAIAREAGNSPGGVVKFRCDDTMNVCQQNIVAYALSGSKVIVNCPTYYTIAATSQQCDVGDQALTAIHELSHIDAVYSPATADHAYGEDASLALSSDMALMNADTYTYYANGDSNGQSSKLFTE
ncbi:hypothetical protein ACJ72_04829 [Emergomyces africanus]|uniref:Neutral protease 2 n=1 Tax=Emergomyces africanus TaxID=1955775 RepID=A0A1B7NVN0_9EURO|nr:hypothetical protein ACJ72_04829 [Emergomyces africanus]